MHQSPKSAISRRTALQGLVTAVAAIGISAVVAIADESCARREKERREEVRDLSSYLNMDESRVLALLQDGAIPQDLRDAARGDFVRTLRGERRFASGGVLPPGKAYIVGDTGPELIRVMPPNTAVSMAWYDSSGSRIKSKVE